VSYKSRGAVNNEGPKDQGATATLETETDITKDAQAIYEKSLAVNKVFASNNLVKLKFNSIKYFAGT